MYWSTPIQNIRVAELHSKKTKTAADIKRLTPSLETFWKRLLQPFHEQFLFSVNFYKETVVLHLMETDQKQQVYLTDIFSFLPVVEKAIVIYCLLFTTRFYFICLFFLCIIQSVTRAPGLPLALRFPLLVMSHLCDSQRHFFLNLNLLSCNRDLKLCGFNSLQFSSSHPWSRLNFKSQNQLVARIRCHLACWPQIPNLCGKKPGVKWHLVNASTLWAVVLLTSPNYRIPIGWTDGRVGANPGVPTSTPELYDMPFCF